MEVIEWLGVDVECIRVLLLLLGGELPFDARLSEVELEAVFGSVSIASVFNGLEIPSVVVSSFDTVSS